SPRRRAKPLRSTTEQIETWRLLIDTGWTISVRAAFEGRCPDGVEIFQRFREALPGSTPAMFLREVARQRSGHRFGEAEDARRIEAADDEPADAPRRQERHFCVAVARRKLRPPRRRTLGDEQRNEGAAVSEDDMAEAPALIDAGVPLEHLERRV